MKILSAVTALVCLLTLRTVSFAQTIHENPPDCQPSSLNQTLAFGNESGEHVVAVNDRNISEKACVLNGGIGAMFDNWHEGHNIWARECRNCDAAGTPQPAPPLLLGPGESGYLLLRWKSVSDGSAPCEDSDGFNTNYVAVVAMGLLDHVCSVVDERSFLPGSFGLSPPEGGPSPDPRYSGVSIQLTAPDSVLYAGDPFPFRAVIRDPKEQLILDDQSCPMTFIRTRDAAGSTMFHQISGSFPRCRLASSGTGRMIEMEMRAPGLGVLNIPGTTSVQFYVVAGPANASEVAMTASNQLQMKIVNPATIPPVWGPETAGIAVSLVLDKQNYKAGEDIPLRINLENFRAAPDIASGELPCGAGLTIKVRDSAGALVPVHGLGMLCTGHGWQTGYPAGKSVLVPEMSLRALGMLPDRPGTYTVTATWNARSFVPGEAVGIFGRSLQPFAVAQSRPVTLRILPEPY